MTTARAGCVGERSGGGMGIIGVGSKGIVGEGDREEERELDGELGEERGIAAEMGAVPFRSPFSKGTRSVS